MGDARVVVRGFGDLEGRFFCRVLLLVRGFVQPGVVPHRNELGHNLHGFGVRVVQHELGTFLGHEQEIGGLRGLRRVGVINKIDVVLDNAGFEAAVFRISVYADW